MLSRIPVNEERKGCVICYIDIVSEESKMNSESHTNRSKNTARIGAFAEWIDSCVRNNIETALITFEPYHVLNPVGGRPYHVAIARMGLMLRNLERSGAYDD